MIKKEIETHVVVINRTPLRHGYYKVEFAEADGTVHELKVHEEAVLDYRLVMDKELDKKTFEQLEGSNEFQKAYAYAINILSRRLYSEQELRRKLKQREVDDATIESVIEKLYAIKLLDDFIFTTTYIESQLRMGRKSRRQITSELFNRGVAESTIQDLEYLFNKEDEKIIIIKEIAKAYERYSKKDLTDFELRNKIITALGRKGFGFDEIGRQYGYFLEDLRVRNE